jgi:hypothetical protein
LHPVPVMVLDLFRLRSFIAAWVIFLVLSLFACSPKPTIVPTPAATPTKPVGVVIGSEPTQIPTNYPAPTDTPEPLPDVAILLAPPNHDHRYYEEIKGVLEETLSGSEIKLKSANTLTREDMGEHVRLVTAIGPENNLAELISAFPATQFVVIGSNGLSPQNNLSIISSESPRFDQQAFMAGVIAAVITSDWRIGIISTDEISSQAFVNGGVYFCGLCRQVYPPFFDDQGTYIKFPIKYIVHPEAGDLDWQTAGGFMIDRGVKTVYLPTEAQNHFLMDVLEEAGVNIIGAVPNMDDRPNWIATIHFNPVEPLRQLLLNLLQGTGGSHIQSSLEISEVNRDLFSPARLKLAQSILEELEGGFIYTGVEITQ